MMWMILQAEESEDWVIATGKTTKIRDFVKMAFDHVGIELGWDQEPMRLPKLQSVTTLGIS